MQRKIWLGYYINFFIKCYGPLYWLPFEKWGDGSTYFSTFTRNIDEKESAWHFDMESKISYGHHYDEITGAYYSEEHEVIIFDKNRIYYNDYKAYYDGDIINKD